MEQIIEKNVRFCGCCHRELPVDSFYVDKRTLAPDNYCKHLNIRFGVTKIFLIFASVTNNVFFYNEMYITSQSFYRSPIL